MARKDRSESSHSIFQVDDDSSLSEISDCDCKAEDTEEELPKSLKRKSSISLLAPAKRSKTLESTKKNHHGASESTTGLNKEQTSSHNTRASTRAGGDTKAGAPNRETNTPRQQKTYPAKHQVSAPPMNAAFPNLPPAIGSNERTHRDDQLKATASTTKTPTSARVLNMGIQPQISKDQLDLVEELKGLSRSRNDWTELPDEFRKRFYSCLCYLISVFSKEPQERWFFMTSKELIGRAMHIVSYKPKANKDEWAKQGIVTFVNSVCAAQNFRLAIVDVNEAINQEYEDKTRELEKLDKEREVKFAQIVDEVNQLRAEKRTDGLNIKDMNTKELVNELKFVRQQLKTTQTQLQREQDQSGRRFDANVTKLEKQKTEYESKLESQRQRHAAVIAKKDEDIRTFKELNRDLQHNFKQEQKAHFRNVTNFEKEVAGLHKIHAEEVQQVNDDLSHDTKVQHDEYTDSLNSMKAAYDQDIAALKKQHEDQHDTELGKRRQQLAHCMSRLKIETQNVEASKQERDHAIKSSQLSMGVMRRNEATLARQADIIKAFESSFATTEERATNMESRAQEADAMVQSATQKSNDLEDKLKAVEEKLVVFKQEKKDLVFNAQDTQSQYRDGHQILDPMPTDKNNSNFRTRCQKNG